MRYIQTTTGRNALIDERSGLTAHQRAVLMLCERARSFDALSGLLPRAVLSETLESLLLARCLVGQVEFAGLPGEGPGVAGLSEAERFRVAIGILTSLAAELPFVTRVRVQLRIERVNDFGEALTLAGELAPMLVSHRQVPTEVNARLHRLRRLVAVRAQ